MPPDCQQVHPHWEPLQLRAPGWLCNPNSALYLLSQPQTSQQSHQSHLRNKLPEVVSKPAFKPRNIKKPGDTAKDRDKISQDKSTNARNFFISFSDTT